MPDSKVPDLSTKSNVEEGNIVQSLTDKQKQNIQKYMEMNLWMRIFLEFFPYQTIFKNLNAKTALEWEPNFTHLIA